MKLFTFSFAKSATDNLNQGTLYLTIYDVDTMTKIEERSIPNLSIGEQRIHYDTLMTNFIGGDDTKFESPHWSTKFQTPLTPRVAIGLTENKKLIYSLEIDALANVLAHGILLEDYRHFVLPEYNAITSRLWFNPETLRTDKNIYAVQEEMRKKHEELVYANTKSEVKMKLKKVKTEV